MFRVSTPILFLLLVLFAQLLVCDPAAAVAAPNRPIAMVLRQPHKFNRVVVRTTTVYPSTDTTYTRTIFSTFFAVSTSFYFTTTTIITTREAYVSFYSVSEEVTDCSSISDTFTCFPQAASTGDTIATPTQSVSIEVLTSTVTTVTDSQTETEWYLVISTSTVLLETTVETTQTFYSFDIIPDDYTVTQSMTITVFDTETSYASTTVSTTTVTSTVASLIVSSTTSQTTLTETVNVTMSQTTVTAVVSTLSASPTTISVAPGTLCKISDDSGRLVVHQNPASFSGANAICQEYGLKLASIDLLSQVPLQSFQYCVASSHSWYDSTLENEMLNVDQCLAAVTSLADSSRLVLTDCEDQLPVICQADGPITLIVSKFS